MARDKTVQERIETILHASGVSASGPIAQDIWEEIKEDQVDFIAQEVALREEIERLRREREDLRMFCKGMANNITKMLD